MENFKKFEAVDYTNDFAVKINAMHKLVAKNLTRFIDSDGLTITDIGGGPGVGAALIDKIGKNVRVINIEPSNNVNEVPELKYVKYSALKMSLKEALAYEFQSKADFFLMVSAAHEIALSNGLHARGNKEMFFSDIKTFLKTNANPQAVFAIGFPNYKKNVTDEEVAMQRDFVNSAMGHSHPPEEFFTIHEFIHAFAADPVFFEQVAMPIKGQTEDETKLMANFAVFKIRDIY